MAKALFKNASGVGLDEHPNGQPCEVVRRCVDASDPYLVEHGLQEEAPCYLIKLNGEFIWALLEEITIC